MIAIILAAGSGRRLKMNKPKGMLTIGDRPLIQHSLDALFHVGIDKVIIATGFGSSYYTNYFSKTGLPLRFVHNSEFSSSGSLYSLYLVLQALEEKDDLIILDSDILYNIDEFKDFVNQPFRNSIFATTVPEGRNDACYVETDLLDTLSKITKNVNYISDRSAELWEHIGVCKTSSESIDMLIKHAEKKFESNGSLDHEYDYAFEDLEIDYRVIRYKDYIWSEADDNDQLFNMMINTYPKLNLHYS